MYQTVIVPLDGSALAERALPAATAVAAASGAAVQLLQVVTDRQPAEARAYLDDLVATLDLPAAPPIVVEADWPAECIADAARGHDRSLVVISSHGSSGARRALLGSVTTDLLALLAAPVLVIGPACADEVTFTGGRLLACTDGSALSEAIVPVAAAWCGAFGLEPWLTTVVAPNGTLDDLPGISDSAEANYVRALSATLADRGLDAAWEVLHDRHPAEAIVSLAGSLPASVVALATHGATGLHRGALGSVASRVVHAGPAPVLVLRPTPTPDARG